MAKTALEFLLEDDKPKTALEFLTEDATPAASRAQPNILEALNPTQAPPLLAKPAPYAPGVVPATVAPSSVAPAPYGGVAGYAGDFFRSAAAQGLDLLAGLTDALSPDASPLAGAPVPNSPIQNYVNRALGRGAEISLQAFDALAGLAPGMEIPAMLSGSAVTALDKERALQDQQRRAAGLPTIAEENAGSVFTRGADLISSVADSNRDRVSPAAVAAGADLGQAIEGGAGSALQFALERPEDLLMAAGPSVAVSMLPVAAAGRLARLVSASREAQVGAGISAASATAAEQNATQAFEQVIADGGSIEDAEKAWNIAFAISGAGNLALMAASTRLGLNPVDEMLATGRGATAPAAGSAVANLANRGKMALGKAGLEAVDEAPQEMLDTAATDIASGRPLSADRIAGSGVVGALAGAGAGAGASIATDRLSPPAAPAPALADEQAMRDAINWFGQPAQPGDTKPRIRVPPEIVSPQPTPAAPPAQGAPTGTAPAAPSPAQPAATPATEPVAQDVGVAAGQDPLAPRTPMQAALDPTVTREQLLEEWRAAQTENQKAVAAGKIAAFDIRAQEAPNGTPENQERPGQETVQEGQGTPAPGPAAAQEGAVTHGQEIKALNDYLATQPGYEATVEEAPLRDSPAGPEKIRVTNAIKQAFGVKTVVQTRGMSLQGAARVPGAPGVVFVDEAADDPFSAVLAHEALHDYKTRYPRAYQRLSQKLRAAGMDVNKFFLDSLSPRLAPGETLSESIKQEELIAETKQELLSDRTFLNELRQEDPSLFRELADSIIEFLDKVMARIREGAGPSSKYYRDTKMVRDAFKSYLKEVATAERGKQEAVAEPTAGDSSVTASRKPAMTANERARENPLEVSTRSPSAKANKRFTPEDATANLLISDFASGLGQPKWLESVAELVESYPNYRPLNAADTPEKKLERLVKHMVDNLLWLHDQVPPAIRARSKLWYDGANAIAKRWSKKYKITEAQAAGILAVLSPQKDWFMNISLAERVLDTMAARDTAKWSDKMSETADRIFGKEDYQEDLAEIRGKALKDIDDLYLKGMWVRIYDQANNSSSYQVYSPEGDPVGEARKKKKKKQAEADAAKVAWGGISTIAKAISIFEDGSAANIGEQLGRKHKVRNFYNNILVPNSKNGHVTIDTHAVAAALLRALSGNSLEVKQNFGGPKSAHAGLEGTYALYEEAYRRAAEARGVLPREMQSITWEAIRGMYVPGFKSQQSNVEAVDAIWNKYKKGRITHEQAQRDALELAGRIDPPSWSGRDTSTYVEEEEAFDDGDVSGDGVSGEDSAADRRAARKRARAASPVASRRQASFDEISGQEAAKDFHSSIVAAKKVLGDVGAAVYVYPEKDYRDMRLFLSPDKKSGFAIKSDGDLVSVFSSERGRGDAIVSEAVSQGATKLDAFDIGGYLPSLYGRHGFVETARDKWNPDYAPPGWPESLGTPDVVYMERDSQAVDGPVASRRNPQVDTPEFRRWFGDSKVVDAQGRPLVVYHGTASSFDAFSLPAYFTEHAGEASAYTDAASLMRRERALAKPKYRIAKGADQYAGQRVPYAGIISDAGERGDVVASDQGVALRNTDGSVTLFDDLIPDDRTFNPAEMTVVIRKGNGKSKARENATYEREALDAAFPADKGVGGNIVPVYLSITNPKEMSALEANRFGKRLGGTQEQWAAAVDELEAQGFDGIVTSSDDPGFWMDGEASPQQWIPLRLTQIKSATGNSGAFDPANPSIIASRKKPGFNAKPIQPDAVSVVGIHYSSTRGRTELDPTKAGLGAAGREQRRFGMGNYGKQGGAAARVAFYVQEPGAPLPKPEQVVIDAGRNIPYRVTLNNLYDYDADPRDLVTMNKDATEEAIADEGFDGYVTEGPAGIDSRVAVVYDIGKKKVPVEAVDGPVASRRNPQTDTPAFKAWFGDSKVVDANGEPLVVYHGTSRWDKGGIAFGDVTEFDRFFTRKALGRQKTVDQIGTWFADRPDEQGAGAFAYGATYPVYLSIKNPWRPREGFKTLKRLAAKLSGVDPDNIKQPLDSEPLREWLVSGGYDGIAFPRGSVDGLDSTTYVAFSPTQIKSATGNTGAFDPANPSIIASRRAPTFYSAALRTIEQAKDAPKKGTAVQWKQWLDGAIRRGEMKQSERDWLGLDAWLGENEPVTREALADFVRANQVQVQDVVLGAESDAEDSAYDDAFVDALLDRVGRVRQVSEEDGDLIRMYQDDEITERMLADQLGLPVSAISGAHADAEAEVSAMSGASKFSQFQLPGGTNYRELLLTLPERKETRSELDLKARQDAIYAEAARRNGLRLDEVSDDHLTPEEEAEAVQINRVLGRLGSNPADTDARVLRSNFRSTHFDQPNILAHVRFNERTDADGKKVLFIEEIQSDWHQKGRKDGYKGNPETTGWTATKSEGDPASGPTWAVRDARGRWILGVPRANVATPEAAIRYAADSERGPDGNRVPDAPLKKTDEWAMLAFKRMVRWAAENGFDSVAWTTGEQQAERYDLSKHIDSIEYRAYPDDTYDLSAIKDGREVLDERSVSIGRISDVVGKEVADKIKNGDGAAIGYGGKRLSGLDLKVGGEGMRGFYDKILPSAVNKWVKRFGGKVAEAKFRPDDSARIGQRKLWSTHAMPLTDAMRDAALEGLPVFARGQQGIQNAQQRQQSVYNQAAASGVSPGNPITGKPNPKGKLPRLTASIDFAREFLQDKMLRLAKTQDMAGITLPEVMNAYQLENHMHGRVRDELERVERDMVAKLSIGLRNSGLTLEQFEDFIYARHAEERNVRVAKTNKAIPDGGSGLLTAEARGIMTGTVAGPFSGKKLSQQEIAKAKQLARYVDAMRDETLKILENSQQLTPAMVAKLRASYVDYVPLRGQEETEFDGNFPSVGKGLNAKKPAIKRALGRGRGNLPKNIVAEMIGDLQRAIIGAEKARVTQAFLKFAIANPMPDMFTVEPVDLEWKYSEATGEAYLGVKNVLEDADRTLLIPHNGSMVRIRFEDKRLADAMVNLSANDMDLFTKVGGAINRARSAMLTRYNPGFVPVNLVRDALFGSTAILAEQGPKIAAETGLNYAPAFVALMAENYGRMGNLNARQKKMLDWAREFSAAGGKTGMTKIDDVIDLQKKMAIESATLMQLAAKGKPFRLALEAVKRGGGSHIVQAIESANDAIENTIRLAVYVAMRESGKTQQQSIDYAKNVTINFNRKGRWGSTLNAIYLFYNASIQGSAAVIRVAKHPAVAGMLAGLAGLQFVLAGAMMGDDDEDGVTAWDMIPDYVKRTSFIIPLGQLTGNDQDYFAIPMPFGFNLMPYSGGRMRQWLENGARATDNSVVMDIAKSSTEAFSPVPLFEGYNALFGDTLGFMMNLYANKDDQGRPIAKEDPYGKYPVPAALTGRPDTPRRFHAASQLLANIGGANLEERVPPVGFLDIAPEKLQEVEQFFTGGIGSIFNKTNRWWEQFDAGNFERPMDMVQAAPIASRFLGDAQEARAVADRYYAEAGEFARYRDLLKDELRKSNGDLDKAQEALAAMQERFPALEGLEFDTYKRRGSRTADGVRREWQEGDIKMASDGMPKFKPGAGSAYQSLKTAEQSVEDLNKTIRQLRGDMTTGEAVAALDQLLTIEDGGPTWDRREKIVKDLGLQEGFDEGSVIENRARLRAIKMLQAERQRQQQAFLKAARATRD